MIEQREKARRQAPIRPRRFGARVLPLVPAVAVAGLAALLAQRRSGPADRKPPVVAVPAPPAAPRPRWLPAQLPFESYAGAAACAPCHRAQYDEWRRSPHGRAGAAASAETVLAPFDGRSIALADGTVTVTREAGSFAMDVQAGGSTARYRVERVLASGHQHQTYLTLFTDGSLRLLPLYWATQTREWVPFSTTFREFSLLPGAPGYWALHDMRTRGCLECHASQHRSRGDGTRLEIENRDPSINCEACHGPGRDHVASRTSRAVEATPYRDLHQLDKSEEAVVCGRCHGLQHNYRFPGNDLFFATLAAPNFRPDSTQMSTSYQYAGHVTSRCHVVGSATCSSCHDPHTGGARDLAGRPAEGFGSDAQCTVCHSVFEGARERVRHSHHPAGVTCTACHMPLFWLGDSPAARQRVSDHSISIPHPAETLALRTQNACGNCHADRGAEWAARASRRWAWRKAAAVRPWVETIALARKAAPAALDGLLRLADDAGAGRFLRLSAVDLLALQPPDPRAAALLTPLASAPDTELRAFALRGLTVHDPRRALEWRETALADRHPFVRLFVFDRTFNKLPPGALGDRELTGILRDVLDYGAPSEVVPLLMKLGKTRQQRGELGEALRVVVEALALASPLEVAQFQLRENQAHLGALLAAAGQPRAVP